MKNLYFLFLFYLAIISNLLAGEPSKEPILSIETDMHISAIKRISIDKNEKYIVTASDDKTIRVWDFKNGNLLKILRPPIGIENEGKIYAVAISPDAKYVAGGGDTGYFWDKGYSVYIFDLKTDSLTKKINNLPNVINELTYSKDGKYLAVGIWGGNGIKIYDADNYKLIFDDKNYGDSVYGVIKFMLRILNTNNIVCKYLCCSIKYYRIRRICLYG